MLILGLLAVLQMAFLPGFLLVYGFRLCRTPVRVLTSSFSLSALLNFFLVASCLGLGIYTRPALVVIITAESLLLLHLLHRRGVLRLLLGDAANEGGVSREPRVPPFLLDPKRLLTALALAVIALSCSEVILRLGDTFTIDDAIHSWNGWAMEMASNRWPARTFTYPQLLPANYSIVYVLTGDKMMWPFAKAWMSFSFPVLLLSVYAFFRDEDRWEIALAVPLTAWLFYRVMAPPFVYGGIADIALAAFAFQAVAALLRAGQGRGGPGCRRELLLGGLFATVCALTKQGGLLVLIVYPVLAWTWAAHGSDPSHRRGVRTWLLCAVPLMLLTVVPWYVPDWLESARVARSMLAAQVLDFHQGRHAGERLVHALHLLSVRTSWWALKLMGTLMLSSLAVRRFRAVLPFLVVPYFLFWSIGFSYDHRNAALLLPFVALLSALGAGVVWRGIVRVTAAVPGVTPAGRRLGAAVVLALVALTVLSREYNAGVLTHRHDRARIAMTGIPALNRELDRHLRQAAPKDQVLTTYKTMRWVPRLGRYWYPVEISRTTGLETYRKHLARPRVRFVLFDSFKTRPEVTRHLEEGLSTGEFEKLFELSAGRFILYRKLRPPQPDADGNGHHEGRGAAQPRGVNRRAQRQVCGPRPCVA